MNFGGKFLPCKKFTGFPDRQYVGTVRADWLVPGKTAAQLFEMIKPSPFRYFRTSPEIIRLELMMYVRFPLSLRNVEDFLHERGIDVRYESVRVCGTALVRLLRLRFANNASRKCALTRIGNGTWTRYS